MNRRQHLIRAGIRGFAPGANGRLRLMSYQESEDLRNALAVQGVALPPPPAPPPAPPAPAVVPAPPVDERAELLRQAYPEFYRGRPG